MAQIFPIDFDEKLTIAQDDFILFSDSEDGNKIKKAQYSNLKGEKGDQGNPGTAATITVGSTTTGTPGSSASVVNSGTTSAAVLDFTIPEGEKGETGDDGASIVSATFSGDDIVFTKDDGDTVTLTDAKVDLKGDTGDAATISVGTTTTGEPGTNASVTNSGTSAAAVFNFTIPKGSKGDTGAPGSAATISVGTTTTGDAGTSASVTNSGTSSAAVFNFTIPKGDKGDTGAPGADGQDGADGEAATITVGSTTTGNPGTSASVVNSGTSSAAVFDFTIPQGATGATGNGIASVTSSKSGKITTVTITETDGDSSSFQISDGADGQGAGDIIGPNSSTEGHLAVFDGTTGKILKDGGAVPVVPTNVSDFTNDAGYVTDSIISDTAYGSGWDGDTTHAPTKNAVYDKIDSIDELIPSAATSSNKLADTNYVNDSINSITAYYITKNAAGDQFATYAELAAATTFYSGGVVRVPTRNDYCIVLADENHDNATTRYIYQNSQWEYQYTVNETALTQAQLDALNSGITSGKVSTYDGYATTISGKQDSLTLPSTPTQGNLVTWGADNETLVDGGAIPTGFSPASAGTTGNILIKTAGGYDWGTAPDVSNVKAFYLASTSDLTNAQAAYDWIQDGKEAILIYNGAAYIRDNAGGDIVFRSSSKYVVAGNSYNGAEYYMLQFTKSGSTITAIIASNYTSNYLEAGKDYTTPYTPTYNGSPATKKYVDDNVAYVGSSAPSSPTEGKLWYDTTNDVLKVYNGSSWDGVGGGLPTGGTNGQILMMVSGTPTWVTPVNQGFIMQASGSPTAIKYIWAGTEAQYSSATKNANTHYDTY